MNNWIIVSFITTFITALSSISLKIIDASKYDNYFFLALSFIIMGLISFFYLIIYKDYYKISISNCDNNLLLFVTLFAILIILTNIFIQYSFKISPNIGYSHIIINLNVIISLIFGYLLFKQKINIQCLLGIFIALIGISILIYYSNN